MWIEPVPYQHILYEGLRFFGTQQLRVVDAVVRYVYFCALDSRFRAELSIGRPSHQESNGLPSTIDHERPAVAVLKLSKIDV